MIHRIGMQTLEETQLVSNFSGIRHQVTHPSSTVPVLPKGFDRLKHQLTFRITSHSAKPLTAYILFRHRLAVHLMQARFVVEEIHMRRCSILK